MNKDWVKIAVASTMHEAEIIKGSLEAAGFAVVLIDQKDSMYGFGVVHICVRRDDAVGALHIINRNELPLD